LLNHLFSPNCTLEWTDDAFSTWLAGQKLGAGKTPSGGVAKSWSLCVTQQSHKNICQTFSDFSETPSPAEMFNQYLGHGQAFM